jgi:hypothetical protein
VVLLVVAPRLMVSVVLLLVGLAALRKVVGLAVLPAPAVMALRKVADTVPRWARPWACQDLSLRRRSPMSA